MRCCAISEKHVYELKIRSLLSGKPNSNIR
jgi:hypothetical protein